LTQASLTAALIITSYLLSNAGEINSVLASDHKRDSPKSVVNQKFEIENLLQKGRTAEVRNKLRSLGNDPTSLQQKQIWLACCFGVESRYEEAHDGFKRCGDLSGQPAVVLRYAAKSYAEMQDPGEAVRLISIIKPEQRTFADYDLRGDCNGTLGKTDLAAADFRMAAALSPARSGGVLAKSSGFYMRAGKAEQALKVIDDALSRGGSDYIPAIMGRTVCLERLGRFADAAQSATRAIELTKPGATKGDAKNQIIMSAAIAERIKCYDKLGKKDLAAEDRKWQNDLAKTISKDIGFSR
jgi:tetratricopeptide (TPR) repeat protein